MNDITSDARFGGETHVVENQPPALQDYNLFKADLALQEAVVREGASWALDSLTGYGELCGRPEMIELGHQANRCKPELFTHDRFGHRINEVRFHPAYHQLMSMAIEGGLHASPWSHPGPGAHVARAARYLLHAQLEAGHGCPITMTFAAIPALRHQSELAVAWESQITTAHYDARNIPPQDKSGLTVGMAMTEKQGGSDVRANSTRAYALGAGGPGQPYELVGHKYFVSAPMCDLFLVLAHAPGGLSCFLLPRWHPDGHINALHVIRLKDKMGNASNASSETELRGALAWMVGEEGRGVATILEMVAMTRFDCMIGSAAGMRQAAVQALHHCSHRSAFGKRLWDQPLMRNVLADLALESEAATALALRMARAVDNSAQESEQLLVRLGTAFGKYWICKRTPGHAYEAMECIGGSGVMEDTIMPRLYREAPVNAIWEGSGNIQALDMLRAAGREPRSVEALMEELALARGADKTFDAWLDGLGDDLADPRELEYRARDLAQSMALGLQASLLIRAGCAAVSDAFIASRLSGNRGQLYGALPAGIDCQAILNRSWPVKLQ
ncbi:MAG: acyl-CoA dehydrogenase family protein [Gammaproteobacteria bacterium]|nr:acyl-CoA dehydrogenase family protein [Gammaproteobacteria bacterium]